MALPQELVDISIDHLHNDIPTLKACSLAARAFVHSARPHLLFTSLHIEPLVEDLCIVLVGPETSFDHDAYDDHGEYMKERHVTWVMAGRTLSLVLLLLNLKRISLVENVYIDWNDGGEYSMDWTRMRRQLKSVLANVFSSLRLEAVHLRGMVIESPSQPLSLFGKAMALKEMSLSRLYFTRGWVQLEQGPMNIPL
ncbi:hypothetical protein MVEN_01385400 [Mycena venus]|uniref:Uncharacterized protein n=1 Tax=Mycena venus TaxID=2733690 RepID=A0A8H6XW62_9AGAR|nr:hypothetical protein MVEN_01385400 [Mycena venus]